MSRRTAPPAAPRRAEEEFMTTEIRVPQLPESVADAVLVAWHNSPGDAIRRDENLADLETDKVVLEVPAPLNGVMGKIAAAAGTTVKSGQLLATIEEGAAAVVAAAAPSAARCARAAPPAAAAKPDDSSLEPLGAAAGRGEPARSCRHRRLRSRRASNEV